MIAITTRSSMSVKPLLLHHLAAFRMVSLLSTNDIEQ